MKLKDYLVKTIDNRGKNPMYYSNAKYPVIDNFMIKNAIYPDMTLSTRYVDDDVYTNFLRGYVHKNMPIMTLVGNGIGNVTLAPSSESVIVQNTIGFEVGKQLDEIYLYYYLLSNHEKIRNFDRGSGQPSIKKTDILNMDVKFPCVKNQKKIASVLFDIDNKIHLNNQINNNLQEQAKSIYKSWLIDFEPFSLNRTMPDNWRSSTVKDVIQLHDSKRVPLSSRERETMNKVFPYYGATSQMDMVDNYLFDGIYLLLGEDGTVVDSKGFPILQYVDGKFWVNNHAHILTGINGYSVELLYLLFSLTNVGHIVTGAVQPKISQANLLKLPVNIPPSDILKSLDDIIQPIFSKIRSLREETKHLEALRDTLLPKLMSGELDVSGLEI